MRHSVLCKKLEEQVFRYLDIFRTRFYEPKFLYLLISKKSLTVIAALAIKERNAFESQNGIVMVQTSKAKLGGHYRCDFRHVKYCQELELSELCQTQTPPAILKAVSAGETEQDTAGSSVKFMNNLLI